MLYSPRVMDIQMDTGVDSPVPGKSHSTNALPDQGGAVHSGGTDLLGSAMKRFTFQSPLTSCSSTAA